MKCEECGREYEPDSYLCWCDECGAKVERESFDEAMSYVEMVLDAEETERKIPDESTVYGIDCPTGKCEM